MTSRQITTALYWKLSGTSDLLLPRYTPMHWWECDLWRLTGAGYVDEYEIKISAADFRADAKKEDRTWDRQAKDWRVTNKHELMARGDTRGPNRFWFVIPHELQGKVGAPDHAGLIVIHRGPVMVRQAPQLHRQKWTGDRGRIMEACYHRYWGRETKNPEHPEPLAVIHTDWEI